MLIQKMTLEEYYIQKIDDLAYKDIAKFILKDKDITNKEKLNLCIQLFELDQHIGPLEIYKELYDQLEYNEKNCIWELYRKYLISSKTIPKRLILESILYDFADDAEFIDRTLVYVFGSSADEHTVKTFRKFTTELSKEAHTKLSVICTENNLDELLTEKS